MQYINPVDSYGTYPVNFPDKDGIDGTLDVSNDILLALHQDTLNRVVHLKNKITTAESNISSHTSSISTITDTLTTQGSTITTLQSDLNTLDSEVGGNDFSGEYITSGMTHKGAIEAVDDQVAQNTTTLSTTAGTVSTHSQNITSLAGKVSTTALNNVTGLAWSAATFLTSGDNLEVAGLKMDQVLTGLKRGNEFNYRQNMYNWLNINSVSDYSYDSLYDESKIYYSGSAPSSTAGCYNTLRQDFGHATTSWSYYSIIVPVTTGFNRIKMRFNKSGTATVYASLTGYLGPFTEISTEDSWITIPTGTELVIKVSGIAASYLFNYMLALKTV